MTVREENSNEAREQALTFLDMFYLSTPPLFFRPNLHQVVAASNIWSTAQIPPARAIYNLQNISRESISEPLPHSLSVDCVLFHMHPFAIPARTWYSKRHYL